MRNRSQPCRHGPSVASSVAWALALAVAACVASSPASAYYVDVRTDGTNALLFAAAGTPAPTNRVIWFVADTNRDGVPAQPAEGGILGDDDHLIYQDAVDGALLGAQPGRYQRFNLIVPDCYASAAIHVYLWDVPRGAPIGLEGQGFALLELGVRPPPAFGNAEWTIRTALVASQNLVRSGDLDRDGLLDAWETFHFGSTNAVAGAAQADPDADGWSNLEEYLLGTDPTDRRSGLRLEIEPPDHQGARVRFPSVTGKKYRVEFRDDLVAGEWSPLTNSIIGTGGTLEVLDPAAAELPRRFYRIALER